MAPRRFGFALPPIRTTAAKLALGLVACSVVGYLVESNLGVTLSLVPDQVLTDFKLWQLVTFTPLNYSPTGILFGAIILWQMGGFLEMVWGSRKVFVVPVGIVLISGVLTVLLAVPVRSLRGIPFQGGWALSGVVWVLYGLHVGRGQTNFWGLPVTGNVLAAIGAGFVVLGAVFGSWQGVVPNALALALAWGYVRVGGPRVLWLRLQSWRMEHGVKRRSKRLRVISGERNMRSGSDRYLH